MLERLVAEGKAVAPTDLSPILMPLGERDGTDSTEVLSELREDQDLCRSR
jgi:hypothetical protein